MGGEGEGAEEEEHEEHAAVLEVVEVGGVEGAAGGEDAEVGGVEHLDAHVREGAAGDDAAGRRRKGRRGSRRGRGRRRGPRRSGVGGAARLGWLPAASARGEAMLGRSLGDDVDLFGSGAELGSRSKRVLCSCNLHARRISVLG